MNIYLSDILDPEQLADMIVAKRIKVQKHPELPLLIYNYSDLAQYAGEWTQAERVCRGLIVAEDDMRVIARGPSKFFNYGEPSAKTYPLDTMVRVTKKEDGSLGIGWHYEGHYGIATRGSFTSEQAMHATEGKSEGTVFHIGLFESRGSTVVGEIVFPENRIVLDYGDRDELILLGGVINRTGLFNARADAVLMDYRPETGLVKQPHVMTLAEAIALPIPDDEEGYVLDILDADGNTIDHLKLKGARYKELHAAIFGLTERKVWEQMVAGTDAAYIEALPDEVQPWAEAVKARLYEEYARHSNNIDKVIGTLLREGGDRKAQAQTIMSFYSNYSGALFAALDNNSDRVRNWIYNQIKPGHVPFQSVKENA